LGSSRFRSLLASGGIELSLDAAVAEVNDWVAAITDRL